MAESGPTNGASRPNASEEPPPVERAEPERTAADDLAEGLGLLVRGARRALDAVDKAKIEDVGRRAKAQIEQIDKESIQDFSRRAVDNFDASRVEALAEEAGRELMNVVDRVASRFEGFVSQAKRHARGDAPGPEPEPDHPRLRIDEDDVEK